MAGGTIGGTRESRSPSGVKFWQHLHSQPRGYRVRTGDFVRSVAWYRSCEYSCDERARHIQEGPCRATARTFIHEKHEDHYYITFRRNLMLPSSRSQSNSRKTPCGPLSCLVYSSTRSVNVVHLAETSVEFYRIASSQQCSPWSPL
jgi:hypothetical protein